jgi:hypothetical protein
MEYPDWPIFPDVRIPRMWDVSVWGSDFRARVLPVCADTASEAEIVALMLIRNLDLEWCDIRVIGEWVPFAQGDDDYGIGDDRSD